MGKKYTDEDIQKELNQYDLVLDRYQNTKNVYAHDNIGYKYHFSLSNLRMGRKPDWLQHNPFAIDNIRLYLSKQHPNYELLDDKYTSCKTKMRFICHKHEDKGIQLNSFDNIVHNHHTCKYCGYSVLSEIKRLPDSELIKLCNERNVQYVDREQANRQTYIIYKCPNHLNNDLQKMSLDHFRGSKIPCKYCQITSGELRVKQFLDSLGINYIFQHTFSDCKHIRNLEFDFYLPQLKTIIEYDGRQHFEPMKYSDSEEENLKRFELGKKRDEIKNQYCLQHGIKMIRIPYWDYENIEEILQGEIEHINIESSETAG